MLTLAGTCVSIHVCVRTYVCYIAGGQEGIDGRAWANTNLNTNKNTHTHTCKTCKNRCMGKHTHIQTHTYTNGCVFIPSWGPSMPCLPPSPSSKEKEKEERVGERMWGEMRRGGDRREEERMKEMETEEERRKGEGRGEKGRDGNGRGEESRKRKEGKGKKRGKGSKRRRWDEVRWGEDLKTQFLIKNTN